MDFSQRVNQVPDSITLKLNAKAVKLSEEGRHIYNLTAGQLPFKPHQNFIEKMHAELNFLKSFQYTPAAGIKELRDKFINYFKETRKVDLDDSYDCIISNGGKHSIFNALGTIINPGDEVILLAPYWISYPEMVKLWGGTPVVVKSQVYDGYTPSIQHIKKAITKKTKAVIINSPNNPSGVHYPDRWMKDFAEMIVKFPNVFILSDEIYFELSYYDPKPTYFYQHDSSLLERTLVFDGISKSFASTGLRIGYCIAKKELVSLYSKLQAQTSSGANSLVQRGLLSYSFDDVKGFVDPINQKLRKNSDILRSKFEEYKTTNSWYQTSSAFYYLVDLTQMPVYKKYLDQFGQGDHAAKICEDILENIGIAIVPGTDFGIPNSARISFVLEEVPFTEALNRLMKFFSTTE